VAVIIPNPSLPPHWNSYVAVDSADEVAARVTPNGGTLLEPAFDVPGGSGRMAHLLDPMGAPLTLWQAGDHPGAGLVNAPGALTWNDLNTTGPAVAAAFYSTLLGWEFEQLDVEGFEYWAITNDGRPNGGMRPIDPVLQEGVPSHWMPYFGAEDVSVAEARVRRLGGQVHFGPVDVPDGGAFVVAGDPQGGVFALFSGDFDD
jgi:predicted enzyme related to lactoylglutathione lyase